MYPIFFLSLLALMALPTAWTISTTLDLGSIKDIQSSSGKSIPSERILVETDSPYLSPEP